MNLTLPRGLSLQDWTDQIVLDLDNYGAFGKLLSDNWQDWGVQFIANTGLSGFNPPNPYQFDNWQDWAERFINALS